ncbi:hypothetical protein JL720_1257 [Aureococcus anophagefferens]|nr:hypothetical protein JL720_1257 [Aureococcus anophagefferens]
MRRGRDAPASPRGTTPPDPSSPKPPPPREGNNWVFVLIFVVVCAIAFAVRAAAAPDAAPPQTTTTTTAYHGSRVRLPDGAQTITLKPEAAAAGARREIDAGPGRAPRAPRAARAQGETADRSAAGAAGAGRAQVQARAPPKRSRPLVPAPRTATPCSEEAWLTACGGPAVSTSTRPS